MKNIINKVKSVLANKPSNAFLLFLTGYLFTQTMLVNILHTKHPHGGWDTGLGMISTHSILMVSLAALSLSLIALWRATDVSASSEQALPAM